MVPYKLQTIFYLWKKKKDHKSARKVTHHNSNNDNENEVDDNDNDIGPGQTSDGPASAARIHCQ